MALPDPDIVEPANDQLFFPSKPALTPHPKSPGSSGSLSQYFPKSRGKKGSITRELDAAASRLAPHSGDHGSNLFNHPATNRGGTPGVLNGRGGIGSPVTHPGSAGTGQRRVDPGAPKPNLTPGKRIDITVPPNLSTPDNGNNGAPRRANQGISQRRIRSIDTTIPPISSPNKAPNLPNRLAR